MVKKVSVLVGAGSIGQAIIRRVSAPVEEILRVDHILYDGKEIGPIAHFAGWNTPQMPMPTSVLRDSNVSWHKSTFENGQ